MDAITHFSTRLAFETDASDVHADMAVGALLLVDTRSAEAWAQGHVLGAVHLPTRDIAARAAEVVPAGAEVVTYCWGPGCNGATKAALEFAKLGYPVREMLGGFEYWAREGFPVEGRSVPIDPLVTVVTGGCGC
ncbi:rhodanese-like domain-containing protein [Actinokineospora diospyrosa]|uniref:Rhodanese-related sulfurtransferase n=1 Tax=Actinokineospora diospyrosa TaxID=103728 RepID=A0ABT1IAE7_9PSEU|nr:rhodanese-like domain-containing protein [Actinokineospora diospyrosa]MCP2269538.1 Rhodanese-related sulfurtransferase [Actinokineospora diospyrosa]